MIEDFSDYTEVKDGECFTTGLIDGDIIDSGGITGCNIKADNILNNLFYTDSNGNEWLIKEMENGPPILISRSDIEEEE